MFKPNQQQMPIVVSEKYGSGDLFVSKTAIMLTQMIHRNVNVSKMQTFSKKDHEGYVAICVPIEGLVSRGKQYPTYYHAIMSCTKPNEAVTIIPFVGFLKDTVKNNPNLVRLDKITFFASKDGYFDGDIILGHGDVNQSKEKPVVFGFYIDLVDVTTDVFDITAVFNIGKYLHPISTNVDA